VFLFNDLQVKGHILNIINNIYSKTPLLRPLLGLRKNGLYSGVVLLLSKDKEEINEMGL